MNLPNGIQVIGRPSSGNEYLCPKCKDTGWILYQSDDGTEKLYGEKVMLDYARRCDCGSKYKDYNGDLTGFPAAYRECDIYKFDWNAYDTDMSEIKTIAFSFFNDFEKWQEENRGLYLWSKTPGSGKTFLSACIGKSVMMRTQKSLKYITPTEYMSRVSDGYKNKDELDPSERYRECTLLVLDDLGTQMKSDWHEQELFRLIDTRTANGLLTIITSNYNIDDLKLDERLKSRLYASCIPIHLPEVSVRKKKADAARGNFVNKIRGIKE